MRKIFRKIDRRFQLTRPGSVLILVVALLVLMALIGTAFLSTTRVDRTAVVQHTNNTEIDLLLEGVKNMAKATIVGSLNDPSLPFPYRPANSTIAKNWDAPDLYHRYTTDSAIGTTPNDAWLSPRCPTFLSSAVDPAAATSPPLQYATAPIQGPLPGIPVWPCIGEPLTGNTFESPFVLPASGLGAPLGGIPLTYTDRMTVDYVPPTPSNPSPTGSLLTPAFATLSYPDGTSATFPAFVINVNGTYYTYLAGDADGDGMADCGMVKLPVGQIDGLTYYAGVRIIDNSACVNVNTALSRRYDFTGAVGAGGFLPTRWMNGSAPNYNSGVYNLGCFESNVGLAELLETYDGSPADNGVGSLGLRTNGTIPEIKSWLQHLLNSQTPSGVVMTQPPALGASPVTTGTPITDANTPRADFAFTTLGDMLTSQIGRRPSNPGQVASGYTCQPATDTDAAALTYHFIFTNPNAARTPVELALHDSLCDTAPNSANEPSNYPPNAAPPPTNFPPGPLNRLNLINAFGQYGYTAPGSLSTSYAGSPSDAAYVATAWYAENFDWSSDTQTGYPENCMNDTTNTNALAGVSARPRRSIFTANSAVSNLAPQPLLPSVAPVNNLPTSIRPYTVATGMSPITSTLCKASINTATFPDLWRAFWLAMAGDYGLSPLGSNTGATSSIGGVNPSYTVPAGFFDHDLLPGQSIYTGNQFFNPTPADATGANPITTQDYNGGVAFKASATYPQHPQAMFRSTLRDPAGVYYNNGTPYSYIEADQMVLLRSAIAAANATAMRYPRPAVGADAPVFAYDLPLTATVAGTATTTVYARVYGVTLQPYITEVYVSTDTTTAPANTKPYIAVELFNPYNQPIDLTNWQLATVNRDPTAPGSMRNVTKMHTFASGTIPALGYALLENYDPANAGTGITARPKSSGLAPAGAITTNQAGATISDIPIDELETASPPLIPTSGYANQELVLLRPVTPQGAEALDQVPVDSYDFTGLTYGRVDPTTKNAIADVWHYVRGNAVNSNSNTFWNFIYPGRYDASDPTPYNTSGTASTTPQPPAPTASSVPGEPRTPAPIPSYTTYSRRQQGTEAAFFQPATQMDPFLATPVPPVTLGDANLSASYPVTFPFQYLNGDQPGPSTMPAASPVNISPFGQFARNSDMLQIPFVGSYVIFSTAPTGYPWSGANAPALSTSTDVPKIIEMNPLPMDCSFAEDTDVSDDPPSNESKPNGSPTDANYAWNESVGHFAPVNTSLNDNNIRKSSPGNNLTNTQQTIADSDPTLAYTNSSDPYAAYKVQYSTDPTTPSASTPATAAERYWRYHWASRIFDYLTVQNPNDDYFPNVQQGIYTASPVSGVQPVPVQNTPSIPAASAASPNGEDAVPVYGLINLNTAPWRVLSALRISPYDDAENAAQAGADNYAISLTGSVAAGSDTVPDNVELAQAIVYWRDHGPSQIPVASSNLSTQVTTATPPYPYTIYKGPFTSLADILNVPAVQAYLQAIDFAKAQPQNGPIPAVVASPEPDAVQGHLSPFNFYTNAPPSPLNTDGVRNDVEERFDLLSRLSNQVTVKSDVYTVYIVIQGWRNAGSTSASNPPQLVTQKRAAFIIDRTGVTPTSSNVKIINVPTN